MPLVERPVAGCAARTRVKRQVFELRCEWRTLSEMYDLYLIILLIGQSTLIVERLYI